MKTKRFILISVLCFFSFAAVCQAATVNLWNKAWKKGVQIEIRVGFMPNPEGNPVYAKPKVEYDSKITVETQGSADVWWRRELNPDFPTGRYGGWIRKSVFGDNEYDVNI